MLAMMLCLLMPSDGKYVDPKIEYMSPDLAQKWIDVLPKVTDDPKLALLLSRPLIPYTHNEIPRVSQDYDVVWDGEYNRSATAPVGAGAIGVTTLDPQWRNTGGIPEGVRVVNYLAMPDQGDIVVWKQWKDNPKLGPNYGGKLVYTKFPKGTVFMEAMFNTIEGEEVCFEIRTRTKTGEGYGVDHWTPDRFVPCRDPHELDMAVERVEGRKRGLSRLLSGKYRKEQFGFTFPRFQSTVFQRSGYVVTLPELPEDTNKKILKTTSFRSTKDMDWETFEDGVCASPTTDKPGQIYPAGYQGAFFPTSKKSCTDCHRDDGKHAFTELGEGDWYGVTQTNDSVMSWTPLRGVPRGHPVAPKVDPRIAQSPRVVIQDSDLK